MRWIFINQVGRLRSGWRLLMYILGLIAVYLLVVTVLRAAYAVVLLTGLPLPRASLVYDLIERASILSSALVAGYLCARWWEDLPWRSLGLTLHSGWLRDLIIGSAIGFASLVLAVAIAMLGTGVRFSINDAGVFLVLRSMISSGTLLMFAALAEEAMFRGYGLQTLSRARLAWLGVLLTSVPFGLVHLFNPNVVPGFTMINTALAGVWLAAAYLRTRSLWLPLGVHWGWNWALGWFFGLPISGLKIVSNPLLKANDTGPFWLTGGSYGIEGGLAGTIALALFTLFLWRTKLVSATPELLKLTSEENPKTIAPPLSIRAADDPA